MEELREYPIGALAYLFPDMDQPSFAGLVRSIGETGLLEPISIWRGQVVDGRHRYRACRQAGVEPTFEHLSDDTDPIAFVMGKNVSRRHMNTSLRAVTAYRASVLPLPSVAGAEGGCAKLHKPMTQRQAADLLQVSLRSLHHARTVLAPDSTAVPELRQAVEQGIVTASDAARIVPEPGGVQNVALDRVVRGESKNLASAAKQVAAEAARMEFAIPESGSSDSRVHPLVFHQCTVAGLRGLVKPLSVDAIITHPPLDEEKIRLYADLADFAVHALKDTGVLVVMVDGLLLPRIMDAIRRPGLHWVCEFNCQVPWPQRVRHPLHRLTLHRRPVLVYSKGGTRLSGDDVIRLPSPGEPGGERQGLRGFDAAMTLVVERFAQPGQVVCDPCLLGRGGTAVAAISMGCCFIGADPRWSAIEDTKNILAKAGLASD